MRGPQVLSFPRGSHEMRDLGQHVLVGKANVERAQAGELGRARLPVTSSGTSQL